MDREKSMLSFRCFDCGASVMRRHDRTCRTVTQRIGLSLGGEEVWEGLKRDELCGTVKHVQCGVTAIAGLLRARR